MGFERETVIAMTGFLFHQDACPFESLIVLLFAIATSIGLGQSHLVIRANARRHSGISDLPLLESIFSEKTSAELSTEDRNGLSLPSVDEVSQVL